jgi:hypothetical protein
MKTGQKKYDARFGWGVVREVTDKSVKVQFAIDVCEYTLEGKDQVHQLVAMLRDEEYKITSIEYLNDVKKKINLLRCLQSPRLTNYGK